MVAIFYNCLSIHNITQHAQHFQLILLLKYTNIFLHLRISVHWVPALSGLWLVVIVHMGSSEDRAATQGLVQTPNCQLAFSCNSLQKQHRDSWVTLQSTQHTKKTVTLIRPHWDLLLKFLSLHYYTTLESVLGVQRSRQAQGTIICLFGLLFFSQNGITFKKPTKIIKIH